MSDAPEDDGGQQAEAGARALAVRGARKTVVALIGGTVLLVGVILIFIPGPALIVIPAGLGILAIEFEWSRRWLRKLPVGKEKEEASDR